MDVENVTIDSTSAADTSPTLPQLNAVPPVILDKTQPPNPAPHPTTSPTTALTSHDNEVYEVIRQLSEAHYRKTPCRWQIRAALGPIRSKDTIVISATGSGKTLPMFLPLLAIKKLFVLVIVPLNTICEQFEHIATEYGLKTVAVTAANASTVHKTLHEYNVVSMSPELAACHPAFTKLWSSPHFNNLTKVVILDEVHCVATWGPTFRPAYLDVSRLKFLFPVESTTFYLTSATLPKPTLDEVRSLIGLRKWDVNVIHRSNDRRNIHYAPYWLRYPMSSMLDMAVPLRTNNQTLVFFQTKKEAEKATIVMRSMLPPEKRDTVIWFHAGMSRQWRAEMVDKFNKKEITHVNSSVMLSLGVDLVGVESVFVHRAPTGKDGMCRMFQQFGRGGRDGKTPAIAVLMLEDQYSDAKSRKKAEQAEGQRKRPKTATATTTIIPTTPAPSSTSFPHPTTPIASPIPSRTPLGDKTNHQPQPSSNVQGRGENTPTPLPRFSSSRKRKHPANSKDGSDILPEILDWANAGQPGRPTCSREPVNRYFGNNDLPPEEPCWDTCNRCSRQGDPIVPCCLACSPDHPLFAILQPLPSDPPKPTRNPNKTKAPSDYTMTSRETDLQAELIKFRDTAADQLFGVDNPLYGPENLMSAAVLQRLVDITRLGISTITIENLPQETGWPRIYAQQYGAEVLAICEKHRPQPLAVVPPEPSPQAQPESVSPETPPVSAPTKKRAPPTCGACGAVGHQSKTISLSRV